MEMVLIYLIDSLKLDNPIRGRVERARGIDLAILAIVGWE